MRRRPLRRTRSVFRAAISSSRTRAASRFRSSSAIRLIQSGTATVVLMSAIRFRCWRVLERRMCYDSDGRRALPRAIDPLYTITGILRCSH